MRPSNIFRAASFRLAALYAAVFALSVAVLFGLVYWIAATALDGQLRASVSQDVASLEERFHSQGLDELTREINRRIQTRQGGIGYYVLEDPSGKRLTGNIPEAVSMPSSGWSHIVLPRDGRKKDEDGGDLDAPGIEAFCVQLDDGSRLLAGEDDRRIQEAREAIIQAFGWGGASALLLAAAGGAVLSLGFLRRVESINRAVVAIMDGNLAERVPTAQTRDDLDQLAVNFNAMLDRIQALMENVRQVSNDIAHDLRLPLSHLRQKLERVREARLGKEDCGNAVEQAIEDVDGVLRIFSAILRIAQIESGGRRPSFAMTDMTRLATFVAESYAPVAEERGQRLTARVDGEASVFGDQDLLTQMLVNLVENALKHCPEGARIEILLEARGNETRLSVCDDGPGIPEEERENVLQRFYRVDRSRALPGAGLGLALVKAAVELHKGSIALSDNNPGLRATLRFPSRR